MIRRVSPLALFLLIVLIVPLKTFGQTCSGTLSNGQNLVTNGDFSQGYTGWSHDPQYAEFNACGSSCYSVPGTIYPGSNPHVFNQGFPDGMADHSSTSDNKFLMVDGICKDGINLWKQTGIPVEPNTNYFFSVYITSLKGNTDVDKRGKLNFNINGTDITGLQIVAPETAGTWIKVTAPWYSGSNPPSTIAISIQNQTIVNCDQYVDFAIDDIAFTPGCEFGGPGPLPNLGDDFTICGLTTPFTINPHFDAATAASADIRYTWYKDGVVQVTGKNPSLYNFQITSPGTYAVCVDSADSCPKTDILVVTNTYSIKLGPDFTLCTSAPATLDAGFSGPGVTYQWYKNSVLINAATNKTYSVSNAGTYSVTVNDPLCGTQSDEIVVTSYTFDLGSDFILCNSNTATLNVDYTGAGVTYQWYNNSQPIGGATNSTYLVSNAGTYSVTVNDPVCGAKSDQIIITTNTFTLGPDVTLCQPTTATLDAGYTRSGVTYQWYKNSTLVDGATNKTYSVTNPATYSVTVTDPVCGALSDDINVTTLTATPNDGTFCPTSRGGTGIANLSVTPPATGGKYKWFNDPVASAPANVVAKGNNFTTPVLTGPGPYIYYVQDTSTFHITVGPPAVGNGFQNIENGYGLGANDTKSNIVFNALTDFKIDSITVYPYTYNANEKIAFKITDALGNIVGTSALYNLQNPSGGHSTAYKVPVNISVPQGNGYTLTLANGSSPIVFWHNTQGSNGNPPSPHLFNFPTTYSSALTIVKNDNSSFNNYNYPDTYPGYFDWKITKGVNCNRVPVTASMNCPDCIESVKPTVANADLTSFCAATAPAQIKLTVADGSGEKLVWYTGSCGGTKIGEAVAGELLITPPTVTTTYYARWESPTFNCNSKCASVTVTVVTAPTTAIATDKSICNETTVTLVGNVPLVGTGEWSLVSGTGTITDKNSNVTTVTNIGPGDLTLEWKISNDICNGVPAQIIVHNAKAEAPTSLSVDGDKFCEDATPTQLTFATVGGTGTDLVLYSGSCDGTEVKRLPGGGDIILTGTDIPTDTTTYFVRWETGDCKSECKSVTVLVVPKPTAATASDQTICNATTVTLDGSFPEVGTGEWTTTGVGTITDKNNNETTVTGIGVGDLKLVWTITNAPCSPSLQEVIIHRDTLAKPEIIGLSFDTCASLTGLIYSTKVDHTSSTPSTTYTWTSNGTLTVTPVAGTNTASVDIGTLGGEIRVAETFGACTLKDTAVINIEQAISTPIAGPDQTPCVGNVVLDATAPQFGIGTWSTSGSGTFANPLDPKSAVAGLSPGVNILTWTVTGCGGPLSDDVKVTVNSSSIVLDASGPADTMCVNYARNASIAVAGGSGKFRYYWTSSDNSFNLTTTNAAVAVTPSKSKVVYYVYAVDTLNAGCASNLDSVIVHTVDSQNLWFNTLITSNGDNQNDELIIRDINTLKGALPGTTLEVYNRWGSRVYKSDNYDNTWKANGIADGVYYFKLKGGCGAKEYNGWFQLIGNDSK